jgi:hypothetical protein
LRCKTGIAGRLNASRRHDHAHDGACCALSCGKCIDDQGCNLRPGGRSQCCPSYFLETDQRCDGPDEIGCTYTRWSSWMRSAHVVWGVYARTCSEVDPFTAACIGCSAPHTYGVALLDGPSSAANAKNYVRKSRVASPRRAKRGRKYSSFGLVQVHTCNVHACYMHATEQLEYWRTHAPKTSKIPFLCRSSRAISRAIPAPLRPSSSRSCFAQAC